MPGPNQLLVPLRLCGDGLKNREIILAGRIAINLKKEHSRDNLYFFRPIIKKSEANVCSLFYRMDETRCDAITGIFDE
jgi:hypothetical protein